MSLEHRIIKELQKIINSRCDFDLLPHPRKGGRDLDASEEITNYRMLHFDSFSGIANTIARAINIDLHQQTVIAKLREMSNEVYKYYDKDSERYETIHPVIINKNARTNRIELSLAIVIFEWNFLSKVESE